PGEACRSSGTFAPKSVTTPWDGKVSSFWRSLNRIGAVPRQWRRCRTAASSATTQAALIPNENGHFGHSTHTNFHYFLRYFSRLHRTNFSQIPQELFTELIGLALLFSLLLGDVRHLRN